MFGWDEIVVGYDESCIGFLGNCIDGRGIEKKKRFLMSADLMIFLKRQRHRLSKHGD